MNLLLLTIILSTSIGFAKDIKRTTHDLRPSPEPYSECDEPSDEFFYLVQQWPAGYCAAEHCAKDAPERFTIHGLWPNYCQAHGRHEWPQYCTREEFDKEGLSDLLPNLEQNWISLSNTGDDIFWQHEWDKHGTCAVSYSQFHITSQHDFFKTTLDLFSGTGLQGILANENIQPGGQYSTQQIQKAISDGLGGAAYLHCQDRNILVEVYVCYNQELQFVSCSHAGTCNDNEPVQFLSASQTNSPRVF